MHELCISERGVYLRNAEGTAMKVAPLEKEQFMNYLKNISFGIDTVGIKWRTKKC